MAESKQRNAAYSYTTIKAYSSRTTSHAQVSEAKSPKRISVPQSLISHSLHLAYIATLKQPEFTNKIREVGEEARTEHLFARGMMQQLGVTAQHIIDTMIPYLELSAENNDPKLALAAINLTLQYIKAMEDKSSETVERYQTFQGHVVEVKGYIKNQQQQNMDDEIRKHKLKKNRIEQALTTKREKHKEKQIAMDNKIASIERSTKSDVEIVEKEGDASVSYQKGIHWYDVLIGAGSLVAALALGPGVGVVVGATYFIPRGMLAPGRVLEAEQQKTRKVTELYSRAAEIKEHLRTDIDKTEAQIRQLELEECEVKNAEDRIVALPSTHHLKEALEYMGKMEDQFTIIMMFWQNMNSAYMKMKQVFETNQIAIECNYGEQVKKACSKAAMEWRTILEICDEYEAKSDSELRMNYKFLTTDYDMMTDVEVNDIKTRVEQSLQETERMLKETKM